MMAEILTAACNLFCSVASVISEVEDTSDVALKSAADSQSVISVVFRRVASRTVRAIFALLAVECVSGPDLRHASGMIHDIAPRGKGKKFRGSFWNLHLPDLAHPRSEEHTSELQSQSNLVCRLLLEK